MALDLNLDGALGFLVRDGGGGSPRPGGGGEGHDGREVREPARRILKF